MTLKMKQKTLSLFSFGILILALVLSSASAIAFTDSFTSVTLNQNKPNDTFTLMTDVVANFSITTLLPITIMDSKSHTITLTFTNTEATNTQSVLYTVNATGDISSFNFPESNYTDVQFYAQENATSNVTKSIRFVFDNTNFCKNIQNNGNLDLAIDNIKVINGFGNDEEYWYPFDEIEVKLQIENNGNWDIKNIEIEWALYTTAGKKIMDDTLNDFNLKEGKDNAVVFTFKLDENIDEFESEDAILYVKAKGKINDNTAGTYNGEYTCSSEKANNDVIADDDFVILDNIKINSFDLNKNALEASKVLCGQKMILTADVWNIGSDDQEEVSIQIYNNDLGINEIMELGDIDAFENGELNIYLDVPKDVDAKWYNLEVRIFNKNNKLFENYQNDKSTFNVLFELEGNCGFIEPTISAELLTKATENSEMTIKVTIKNPGSKAVDYVLNANGYSTWAELIEISEKNIHLNAGESKEILFKFQTTKESAGERFFDIEIFSDNKLVTKQPVVVSIEAIENKIGDFINNNWKVLIIGLVNLILIIAIIIVAVRTYRR